MRPDPMPDPPPIDPAEYAIQTVRWGEDACHLVRHQGLHYAWVVYPGGPAQMVYPMASEEAARGFLSDWKAARLMTTGWDERVATVSVPDPGNPSRVLYQAAVIDVVDDGIWLATRGTIGGAGPEDASTLASFDELGSAVEAFAVGAEQAAGRIERDRSGSFPDLVAATLRYRAALAHADAARAILGEAIRRNEERIRGGRSVSVVAHTAGVSREFLHRVLTGDEWAWPQRRRARPPGIRLPDTPVTSLATYAVDGHQFSLVSYRDTAGGKCVAIDRDGYSDASLCDVNVSEQHPLGAGMTMATMGHGTAAVYGRAHDSVSSVYAVMKNGERVDWPIRNDPVNEQRYFAVIADCESLKDIVGVTPRRNVSLKDLFGIWFRKAP